MPKTTANKARAGRKDSRGDQRRRRIFKSLHDCILAQGYVKTTLADIAKRADMSASHLLYYFKGKEDILEQYFQTVAERFTEKLDGFQVLSTGLQIEALAFDPTTQTLYAAEATTQTLIAIAHDLTMTPVGGAGALGRSGIRAMAYDTTNDVLYAIDSDPDELLGIDTTAGTAILIAALSPAEADTIEAMTYDPATDALVAVDRATKFLVDIDKTTGVATARGLIEFEDIKGLTIEPGTETLLAADGATQRVVKIDRLTGATIP